MTDFTEIDLDDIPQRKTHTHKGVLADYATPDALHIKLRYYDRACGQYLKPSKVGEHVRTKHGDTEPKLLPRWLSTRY